LNRNKSVVEIDFAELADGSLVEMIEHPEDPTKTYLAVYDKGSVRYTDRVPDGPRILQPLSRDDEYLRHVSLAAGAEPCGSVSDLVSDMVDILGDCLDADLNSRALMSAFAISTWFPEKLTISPYLALVGPPGSGKTAAMLILNSLFYRGLLSTDISSSAFYDISHRIRPTITLDETLTAGRPRRLFHLLRASSTRGFCCLRKDKASLAFGPKVFSWPELPDDQALNSRCVVIPMKKTSRTDLKSPHEPTVLERAKKLRMRLLQFRFEHFRNVSVPKPPPNKRLSGRSLDLYRAVTLSVEEDQSLCRFLASEIAAQEEFRARPLSPAQIWTICVLYRIIHFPEALFCPMKVLAAAVNRELKDRGEPQVLNERKLGDILTSLSLTNRTRTNIGYVLWLNRAERELIHAAARDYNVDGSLGDSIDGCPTCTPTKAKPANPKAGTSPSVKAQISTKEALKIPGRIRRIPHLPRVRRERRERRFRSPQSRAGVGSD
jgi:hypothetical protein